MRKIAVLWLLLGALMVPFAAWAELPADVRKDMYMEELATHLKNEDYQQASIYIDKLLDLTKNSDVRMPNSLDYFEGEVSLKTKDYMRANEALTRYVEKSGKKGRYYRESLAMLLALEEPVAEAQALMENFSMTAFDLKMVDVPAGHFSMGSNDGHDSEKPVHRVRLKAFLMGQYEITQKQWMMVMGNNPSNFIGDELPVEQVSWDDVQAFISKLNRLTGQDYRLPTEAEWEYAARAGTTTPFMTGQCISTDQANYDDNSSYKDCPKGEYRETTVAVGSFSANDWGLYDTHGNVWEWTADCYNKSYAGAPSNGSAWLSGDCEGRVLRGGSWDTYPRYLRSADRFRKGAGIRDSYIGFRVVLSASSVQD